MRDPSLSQSRPPDPLDALEVDDPAGILQYRRDAAISVAAILYPSAEGRLARDDLCV